MRKESDRQSCRLVLYGVVTYILLTFLFISIRLKYRVGRRQL